MDSRETVKSSEGDWMKRESKSHPGHFYLFNKKTSESKWCGATPQNIPRASTLPAPITKSSLRTPAQDRLKRLQNKLKDKHLKEKASQKNEKRRKSLYNHEEFQHLVKSDAEKYSLLKTVSNDDKPSAIPKKTDKDPSPKRKAKKRRAEDDPVVSKSTKASESDSEKSCNDDKEITEQNPAYPGTSTALNIGSGIGSKIKEFKINENPEQNPAYPGTSTELNIGSGIGSRIKEFESNETPEQNPAYRGTSTALNIGSGIVSRIKEFFETAKNALVPRKSDVCETSSDTTGALHLAMNTSQRKRINCESVIEASEQRKCETNAMESYKLVHDENQPIVSKLTLDTKHNSAHLVQNKLVQIEKEKDERVLSNNNTLLSKKSSEHLKKDSWLKIRREQDEHFRSNTNILSNKISLTNAVNNSLMQLRQQQADNSVEMTGESWSKDAFDSEAMEQNQEFSTSKLSVSSYERGSANARLLNLRKSLAEKALVDSKLLNTPAEAKTTSSNLTFLFHENIANRQQTQDDALLEDDAMDWSPTEEFSIIEAIESDKDPVLPDEQNTESVTKSYNTVNENLLRVAEDGRQDKTVCTWLQDHYYFVLDTNVLLRHITFIEDLRVMKLCDTNGTVLYIPYCVLQELDRLKQQLCGEGIMDLARRAIKYLHSKFKSNDKHVQAQSAVSDMEHIIEITSADDKILNCCLQVQRTISNVVLLTEDINLRNKAMCNNILVSTKSDLVAKSV